MEAMRKRKKSKKECLRIIYVLRTCFPMTSIQPPTHDPRQSTFAVLPMRMASTFVTLRRTSVCRQIMHYASISTTCGRQLQSASVLLNEDRRMLSTNIERSEEEGDKPSNRAAFRATPVIPSILKYIEKIGVGMRPRRSKHARRKSRTGSGIKGGGKSDTLNEIDEAEFFAENQTQHRLQRMNKERLSSSKVGVTNSRAVTKKSSGITNDQNKVEKIGAFWLPPPPFSTTSVRFDGGSTSDDASLQGRRVIRKPVKLLGKAGSLDHVLPRESKGLPEVAIAGRSNVGKSTLLNALLYGNTDESLSPRKFQRGGTPDSTKLPKGIKAMTSSKPGQTKELSFYQLTADVISDDGLSHGKVEEIGKMSLLMVDLPGYGFAFAKEERTIEWKNLMHHYLLERRSLKRILFLLDARHGFKKTDFDFLGDLQDGLMTKMVCTVCVCML